MTDKTKQDAIAQALYDVFMSGEEIYLDRAANIADSQYAIAEAMKGTNKALDRLGVNNADTSMGAIEMVALEIRDGFRLLAEAIITAAEKRS